MIQITPQMRVLIAVEPVDFRKGIDGLARLCRERLAADPFSGTVFVFRSRRATAIKLLVYDGRGFWLCQMRLLQGRFRYWPKVGVDVSQELEAHELKVLIAGAAIRTLGILAEELKNKSASIGRLKNLLFGGSTESTSRVLGKQRPTDPSAEKKPKAPGHGRNGAAAYTGAELVKVEHESLHQGDSCPGCLKGKVYPLSEPQKLVRITGMAPLSARVLECDRLRCAR